jgi:hypothetical protein
MLHRLRTRHLLADLPRRILGHLRHPWR